MSAAIDLVDAPDVSIVVPVYRSAPILPRLCDAIEQVMAGAGFAGRFELVLVCDASPDDSWRVITGLAETRPFVLGVNLRRNAGQHNATMAGLARARGRQIVVMDDDLQHPPSFIPALLAELDRGYDACYTRYRHRQHAWWKKLGSRINDMAATLLLRKPKGLYLSSFKAMDRGVVTEIIKYDGPYAYVDGLLLDVTRHIASVDIDHAARAEGRGNYGLRSSVSLWLKMATSFSVFPLRLMSVGGIVLAMLSLAIMVGVIAVKLLHPEWPAGWASLMAAILFVGSIQMIGLGLIGEYLGRAYLKLNHKPQYVVRETTEDKVGRSGGPRVQ